MRLAICQLHDVTVRTRDEGIGRAFGFGAVVDLDERLTPSMTIAQALGDRVGHFLIIETPAQPSQGVLVDEHGEQDEDN